MINVKKKKWRNKKNNKPLRRENMGKNEKHQATTNKARSYLAPARCRDGSVTTGVPNAKASTAGCKLPTGKGSSTTCAAPRSAKKSHESRGGKKCKRLIHKKTGGYSRKGKEFGHSRAGGWLANSAGYIYFPFSFVFVNAAPLPQ